MGIVSPKSASSEIRIEAKSTTALTHKSSHPHTLFSRYRVSLISGVHFERLLYLSQNSHWWSEMKDSRFGLWASGQQHSLSRHKRVWSSGECRGWVAPNQSNKFWYFLFGVNEITRKTWLLCDIKQWQRIYQQQGAYHSVDTLPVHPGFEVKPSAFHHLNKEIGVN